jgi:pimeloyl-ACP methyl ester carboxylesterase
MPRLMFRLIGVALLASLTFAACATTRSTSRSSSTRTNSQVLHMVCQGPAGNGGPTVVLESGFADDSTVWQTPTGQSGSFESYLPGILHVCAYDRAGEGTSPGTSGPQTFTDMAVALRRTLSAHEIIGPLVLVAHSMGADIAITYAHLYPAAVRSVVLLDAEPSAPFQAELVSLIPASATQDVAGLRDQVLSQLNWRQNSEHLNGAVAFRQLAQIRSLAQGIRLVLLQHDPAVWNAEFGAYGPKINVLWEAGRRGLAELVPHTEVQIVPGAGHYIYQDDPKLVSQIVIAEAAP